MKPFQKFVLLFSIPLLIIGVVSLLSSGSFDDIKNARVTTLTIFLFGALAFVHSYIYDRLIKRNIPLLKSMLLSAFVIFIVVISGSVLLNKFLFMGIKLHIPFFQGVLMMCLFFLSVFITSILKNSALKVTLKFTETRDWYFKMILFITLIVAVLLIVLNSDRFFMDRIDITRLIRETGILVLFVLLNTSLTFFLLYYFSKVSTLRKRLLFLVIVVSLTLFLLNYILLVKYFSNILLAFLRFYLIQLFIVVCMVSTILYRNNSSAQMLQIKKLSSMAAKKDAEYQQLKNQINPHFLFNNLNTLLAFIETEPAKAIAFGNHMSNVYRHYLKNQPEDFVLLREELQFISEYLSIYKAKFESGFSFEISNAAQVETYILSSALQEIIDNVFKHNSVDDENPLEIRISVEDEMLAVRNSVHLKTSQHSNQTGIENIRKRYQILSDKTVQIEKTNLYFTVKLPIFESE